MPQKISPTAAINQDGIFQPPGIANILIHGRKLDGSRSNMVANSQSSGEDGRPRN
jgi:hypothetical protein